MDKERDISIFTFIGQIQTKKRTVIYDKKIASAYLLSMFLSMNRDYLKIVNEINKYQYVLSDKAVYEYYMAKIPQGKSYSKFIKKRKEDEKTKNLINKLKEKYPELSTRECMMIISSLKRRKECK